MMLKSHLIFPSPKPHFPILLGFIIRTVVPCPFIQMRTTACFIVKQLKVCDPNQFHSTAEQIVPLQGSILPDGTSIGASFGCQQSSDGKEEKKR